MLTVSWLDLPNLVHGQNYSRNAKALGEEFCSKLAVDGSSNRCMKTYTVYTYLTFIAPIKCLIHCNIQL